MVLYKCKNCGYVSDEKIKKCPKCGSVKFKELKGDAEELVKKSRKTNYLHMKMTKLLVKLKKYAEAGEKENLDPACVKIFKRVQKDSYESYQSIMSEIAIHVNKEKWG